MHIFYNIKLDIFFELQDEAIKDNEVDVKLNELDCSKSFSRTSTEISYEQICDIAKNDKFVHIVFIVRNYDFLDRPTYIEIGLRTSKNSIDYFTFIELPIDRLEYYINKYNLKTI